MGEEEKPSDVQIYSGVRDQLKEEFEKQGFIAEGTQHKLQQAIQFVALARENPSKDQTEALKQTEIFLKAYADQILEIAEQTGNLDYVLSSINAYESLGIKPEGEISKKIEAVIENANQKGWVPSPRGILYEDTFKNNSQKTSKGQRDLIEEGRAYRTNVSESLRKYMVKNPSRTSGLERAVAVVAVSILGLFLISSNITGNTIANLSPKTSSFIGAGLFIFGLITGFILLKKDKLKK